MREGFEFKPDAIAANHCPELLSSSSTAPDRDALMEEFAKSVVAELPEELAPFFPQGFPQVALGKAELLTSASLQRSNGEGRTQFLIEIGAHGFRLVGSIDRAQAISLTDCIYGGSGEKCDLQFSPDSLPLSSRLPAQQVMLKCATRFALAAGFQAENIESLIKISLIDSPNRNPPFVPGAYCLAWPIQISIGADQEWTVRLAALEEDILARLKRSMVADESTKVDPLEFGAQIPLNLHASLAQFPMPLSQLAGLTQGDTIAFTPIREIPLQIGGQVIAHGRIGTLDGRCALRISRLD